MAASSRKGSGMGTPSLKLNTYRWKLPEKWYQVARTLGKSPQKSSEIARTPPYLKVRMYSGPEIHGLSPVGYQYGNFCSVPRYFPRNLQKPETRPIFAMARMSPRESHFFVVDVVRCATNLHMFNSTHQDLSFHGECRLISYGVENYELNMCKFGAHRTTSTTKKWDSRGDMRAMGQAGDPCICRVGPTC